MFQFRVPGVLLVLALLVSVGACDTTAGSYGGKRCVNYQGFEVPCDTPGAQPVDELYKSIPTLWADSTMGAQVLTANGDTVSFSADASHLLIVDGRPRPAFCATRDGSVFEDGLHVGYVVYVLLEDGAIGTALVAPDGTLFDFDEHLRPTDERPNLVPVGSVGVLTEEAVATGLPVADML